jgi:hypothetical protein
VSNDANPTNFGARNHNMQAQQEEIGADTAIGADPTQLQRASASVSAPIIDVGASRATTVTAPHLYVATCPDSTVLPIVPGTSSPPRQSESLSYPALAHPRDSYATAITPAPAIASAPSRSTLGSCAGSSTLSGELSGASGISVPENQQ